MKFWEIVKGMNECIFQNGDYFYSEDVGHEDYELITIYNKALVYDMDGSFVQSLVNDSSNWEKIEREEYYVYHRETGNQK